MLAEEKSAPILAHFDPGGNVYIVEIDTSHCISAGILPQHDDNRAPPPHRVFLEKALFCYKIYDKELMVIVHKRLDSLC